VKLYDAARCPYCARVRLVLSAKAAEYETIEVDLDNRPAWLTDLNRLGKVPVLDDGFVLPESDVIMEYLEEHIPDPPLLPRDTAERARARLAVRRFDDLLGHAYYAHRRGEPNELPRKLDWLPVGENLFVDFAYVPWVIRLRELFGVVLPERLEVWLDTLSEQPAVARELALVRGLG
jgi:Glutathione S-transferase, N-terminal domain